MSKKPKLLLRMAVFFAMVLSFQNCVFEPQKFSALDGSLEASRAPSDTGDALTTLSTATKNETEVLDGAKADFSCDKIPASGEVLFSVTGTSAQLQTVLNCQLLPARASKVLRIVLQTASAGKCLAVTNKLTVYSNTELRGGKAPTGQDFGAVLCGENSAQMPYRFEPMIRIGAAVGLTGNVLIHNLEFTGKLAYSVIEIINANVLPGLPTLPDAGGFGVSILFNRITGSRGAGINCNDSRRVQVKYLSMVAVRKPSSDPDNTEGGQSIRFVQCHDSSIENNILSAPDFYKPGPSVGSGNIRVCTGAGPQYEGCLDPKAANLARTHELIGAYGSQRNMIAHNRLSFTNTAAIYLARFCTKANAGYDCPDANLIRSSDNVIWNNDIQFTRELGIDLETADRVQVLTNRVRNTDSAGIALADTHGGVLSYNVFSRTGLVPLSQFGKRDGQRFGDAGPMGAIYFNWKSTGNILSENIIDETFADYAVFFKDVGAAETRNNQVVTSGPWTGIGSQGVWGTDVGCTEVSGNFVQGNSGKVPCSP